MKKKKKKKEKVRFCNKDANHMYEEYVFNVEKCHLFGVEVINFNPC